MNARAMAVVLLAASITLAAGCQRAPDAEVPLAGAAKPLDLPDAPQAPEASAAAAGTLRSAKPCGLLTAADMSELLGGPIGKPSGESVAGKTSCTYPPADASSYAQAEITIEWQDGPAPSFERLLADTFKGSAAGRQVAHSIELGDDAAYSIEGVLSIRSGQTLVSISLPMRPGAEERAVAVARKLFERAGVRTSSAPTRAAAAVATPAAGVDSAAAVDGLAKLAASMMHDTSSASAPDEEVRIARPAAPAPEQGTPEFPAGLVIGGDCPPPPAEAQNTPPSLVPLTVGLTLAEVWKPHSESDDEEYECLLQVTAVTAAYADVTYTCDHRETVGHRRLCRADLRDSHFYLVEAGDHLPPVIAGATMFSLSTRSLQELKSTTNTAHRYIEVLDDWQHLKHPLAIDVDGNFHSGRYDRETFPIAVNDRVVDLPVLTGLAFRNTRHQTSLTVLDNEELPIVLDYSGIVSGFRHHYTKISFPTSGEIEKHLANDKRVDVYGIYFNFASDRLRPESTPVLAEIAAALTSNSSWKLSIGGHTDGIGNDAANLELSKRRAEAVKDALVSRYGIDGGRLSTVGYGESAPQASNDTPEGRARNRRVELRRL